MKVQCDVCEKAAASVICCADEAALCAECDVKVHAANKLAGKHQRLLLDCLSTKLPRCDICQDKAAFIFCVEDRALFCKECDSSIHVAGTLSGEHQRLLATGIHVALASASATQGSPGGPAKPPPTKSKPPVAAKAPMVAQPPSSAYSSSNWAIEDFLQLSDYECNDKKESSLGFGELEWLADIGLFPDAIPDVALTMAEVPELPISPSPYTAATFYKSNKYMQPSFKKQRIQIEDDEELFRVPDLG